MGDSTTDLGPDELTSIFGPGAFIFLVNQSTSNITTPQVSNVTGVGGHGPSSTAPGSTTEWGIVSSYQITGLVYCISSPVAICNNAGFSHGITARRTLASDTYDLGTWVFDATTGDFEAAQPHITRTSNGGLTNNGSKLRGQFVGASLPALPLFGFAALALSLAVIGGRSLLGKR